MKAGKLFALVVLVLDAMLVLSFWLSASSGSEQSRTRSLLPVTRFATVSGSGGVDEAEYTRRDSFLSDGFSREQPFSFLQIGVDAPPQPFRSHPQDVAVDPESRRLFVTLTGNESEPGRWVAVVDPDRASIERLIPVGEAPFGLLRHPRLPLILVSHLYSNFVSVIDTRTLEEVQRIVLQVEGVDRFYSQRMAWYGDGRALVIANAMTDSVLLLHFDAERRDGRVLAEIPVWTENMAIDTSDDPISGPRNLHPDADHLDPSVFGLTGISNPPRLLRRLTNVNPRDVEVIEDVELPDGTRTDLAYVGCLNGLGVAVVDLRSRKQVAAIDLNSPAFSLASLTRSESPRAAYVFVGTGSRFAGGFDDVKSEVAVLDLLEHPFVIAARYTADLDRPAGPTGPPQMADLVSARDESPYRSAFAHNSSVRSNTANNTKQDILPQLSLGSLPFRMVVVGQRLLVAFSASDEIVSLGINLVPQSPEEILTFRDREATNALGDVFPTRRLQTELLTAHGNAGWADLPVYDNGSLASPEIESAAPIRGPDAPDFFHGRFPTGLAVDPRTRRIYVCNRLGESVTVFELLPNGTLSRPRVRKVDLRWRGAEGPVPEFPFTLAEMGEDFYTSSRIALNRQTACVFCHPSYNTDSKLWDVGATPGAVRRDVPTNRNLRDTPPYGVSGTRSNLEMCSRLSSFLPSSLMGQALGLNQSGLRDTNGDGRRDEEDLGAPQVHVNRDALLVLERAGIGQAYVSAALTAFLEAEPRLLPNPFREADGGLSTEVPVGLEGSRLVHGDAVRGEALFRELGCATCHPAGLYTDNRTFTRLAASGRALHDLDGDGIADAVVPSLEHAVFGPGSSHAPVDMRLVPEASSSPGSGLPGTVSHPVERSLANQMDLDPRVFRSSVSNARAFVRNKPHSIPRSRFPIASGNLLLAPGVGAGLGRLLANEPGYVPDADLTTTGADGRNVNTPSLRNLWDSAPYLHHGRAASILEVLDVSSEFSFRRDPVTGRIVDGPYSDHGRLAQIAEDVQARRDLASFLMSIE